MTPSNDDSRPDPRAGAEDFRRFVEDMARFTTAADDLADRGFRIAFANEHGLMPEEITEEDVRFNLPSELSRTVKLRTIARV